MSARVLTVVANGKACPGGTVLTSALMLAWGGPVLVVDADPGGGDIAPGLIPGRVTIDRGLLTWSMAVRRDTAAEVAAAMFAQHAISLPEAPYAWLVAGVQNTARTGALDEEEWSRLAVALRQVWTQLGRDVLVDTGRLARESCWPVLDVADRVLLAVRPTARSVHAASVAVQRMSERPGLLSRVALVVVGSGEYQVRDVAAALQLPVAGHLPWDPATAGVLSDGARPGLRGLDRSRLVRSAGGVAAKLRAPSLVAAVAGYDR